MTKNYNQKIIDLGLEWNIFPLFTKNELSERWGVSRYVVGMWSQRHADFPNAIEGIVKGGGPYYPFYEVEQYEKARKLK
jgi:hypothetical protein